MSNIGMAFILTFLAGFSTMLGSIIIFFRKFNPDRVIVSALAFAAGVMITVSLVDLIPESLMLIESNYRYLVSFVFVVIGWYLALIIDKYLSFDKVDSSKKGLFKVGILSMIAIVLHNIPEGCSCYVSQ